MRFKQFSLFYIPVWNYGDYEYVLYTDTKIGDADYTCASLSRDEVSYLQSLYSGIPDEPELPFWDAIGGKILLAFIAFLIIGWMANKD